MVDEQGAHLQEINEELYKRNIELAVVNKTLSLLRKLYQISLQSLDPVSLSAKVTESIRVHLNMEVVGVFQYDEDKDILVAFGFSRSERLTTALLEIGASLEHALIADASKHGIYKDVIGEKKPVVTAEYGDVWEGLADEHQLHAVAAKAHVQTVLLYPLVTEGRVIGVLFLGLNRSYDILNKFEKDSITSCIDVVAVALDKALLYEALSVANTKLQVLDKARAEFISIASHQLRTPPATLKWYMGALLSGDYGPLEPDVRMTLEKAQATNNSQISLIDDLLNASRIERGKMEFYFELSDINQITRLTVDQIAPQAIIKKLTLHYEPSHEILPQVMADKEKLRQVINNMIDNAIKYTAAGSITVKTYRTPDTVCVSVSDSGKGMAPDQIKDVFEKYNRGKNSAMQATGLGLGMYVANVIIKQHQGKIWAESPGEGKGSTFTLSIPVNSKVETTSELDFTKPQ